MKENTAASRERFTILTNCLSWTPKQCVSSASCSKAPARAGAGDGELPAGAKIGGVEGPARAGPGASAAAGDKADPCPPIAVLFRAGSGTGSIMRKRLTVPPNTLLQFAPKGSYRLENMLEFFKWGFAPAAHARDSLVFVLDWYAVH